MDRLREDLLMQCRLCSSKSILISLFKGKNKQIRNYIRKLIEITTGIKCEEHDYFGCICYNCVVHIYNMYVFRIKSLRNEERLLGLVPGKISTRGKKKSIKPLKDIELIEYNDLKCMFTNWMQNKLEHCSSESTLSSKNSTQESNSEPLITSVDSYTQTEPPHQHSVSIQTICKAAVTTIYTQTEQSTRNKSTQYKIIKLENKSVNCKIQEEKMDKSNKTLNKSTQCDSETYISTKEPNKHSECVHNKINNIINNSNEKLENRVALCLQFTVPDKNLPSGLDKPNSSLKETKVNNKLKGINKPLSINCSLEATASEYPSPTNLKISPVPSIHLSTPRASELLEITKEVIHLHNCDECDLVMYSEEEVQNHKKNHMKCNLCQKKFRTIERTKVHYEVCKRIMGLNQPYVALERFKIPNELEKSLDTPPKKKNKTMLMELSKRHTRKG